jgi:hypothetical protein
MQYLSSAFRSGGATDSSRQSKVATAAPAVSYILIATFDIDKGSTLTDSYPTNIGGYEDNTLAELMLPEGAHNRKEDWTYFFLNRKEFRNTCEPVIHSDKKNNSEEKVFLNCLNAVKSVHDANIKRGAAVTAIAFCSRYNFVNILKPAALLGLDAYISNPSTKILEKIYNAINSDIDMSTVQERNMFDRVILERWGDEKAKFKEFPLRWPQMNGSASFTMKIQVPLYLQYDMIVNVPITPLLHKFREKVMIIFTGILLEKRILFVGSKDIPAGDVCGMVLAACSLLSPPFPLVPARTFPYANLTDLSFLEVNGYIAGVTNPMFASKPDWWDILCDIETGEVIDAQMYNERQKPQSKAKKIYSNIRGSIDKGKSKKGLLPTLKISMDSKFIARVISGVEAHMSELWLREQFNFHCNRLYDIASSKAEYFDVNQKKSALMENRQRVMIWKTTSMYKQHQHRVVKTPGNEVGVDIRQHIRKLTTLSQMEQKDLLRAFDEILRVLKTDEDCKQFLYFLGDLDPIAVLLLYNSSQIQDRAFALLLKLEAFTFTKPAFDAMNSFLKSTLQRQRKIRNKEDI